MAVKQYIQEQKDYVIGLRRYFHQNPELSLKEYKTAAKIEEELDKIGVKHIRVGETGVVGILENQDNKTKGKTIVLRADIDALPIEELSEVPYKSINHGVMHACGHDAHAASLLCAAKVLKAQEKSLNGKIIFIFQQAEEIGAGAKQFIKAGYLKEAYRVFGIHMASYLSVGKVVVKAGESNASCDCFKITVNGKSAHVSRPDTGIDALYIASQIVVAIQAIVARLISPLESVVVGIGKMEAGTNYNIIANKAILEGTTRSFNIAMRKRVNEKVVSIAKTTAETYGATVTVDFIDYASPLLNDFQASEEVARVANQIVSEENVIREAEKSLGADDFAEYLLETKGHYAYVGSSSNENNSFSHHNERFDIDENALLIAANLYVDYAKAVLKREN